LLRTALLKGLAIICAAPLIATAQDNAITFEQVWVESTAGGIYGGVQTDDALLFAAGEDGIVRALDKTTGKEMWRARVEAPIGSAVAADEQRVYFHSRNGIVHAHNKNNGEPLWTFKTEGERKWDSWDYYLSTPTVDDRQVYFGSGDNHIYALDKRTGHLRWKVRTDNIVHSQPLISGEKVIAGSYDGRLYAIDRGTGRILWTFKTVGTAYFRNGELPGAATAADGLVYAGGRDYNIYALLEDTGTGAWNDKTPSWIIGAPLVVDDELILVNSDGAGVFSYNRSNGSLNWETKTSFNMFAGAKPIGSSHVAVAGLDGRITILNRADGSTDGIYDTEASRSERDTFFNADGTSNYTGVTTMEEFIAWYDRLLQNMGGIAGSIVVEDDMIFYATAGGEIAAVRAIGID
jgi:outer membrane protein assembly factor BamB